MHRLHWDDYIEENPAVLAGKPVAKGTRVSVELILTELGGGMSEAEVLAAYPTLKPEHVRAAYLYAVAAIQMEV